MTRKRTFERASLKATIRDLNLVISGVDLERMTPSKAAALRKTARELSRAADRLLSTFAPAGGEVRR